MAEEGFTGSARTDTVERGHLKGCVLEMVGTRPKEARAVEEEGDRRRAHRRAPLFRYSASNRRSKRTKLFEGNPALSHSDHT
jgi:hypothetical protein